MGNGGGVTGSFKLNEFEKIAEKMRYVIVGVLIFPRPDKIMML